METSEPVSPRMPHAPNHDSMVTVSLSDIQSISEHSQPDWRNLEIPSTPVDSTHEAEGDRTKTESFGPMALRDAARTTPTPFDEPPTPTLTDDKTRDKTLDEEMENEVDWENLEKSEEQEPRGEGSDESTALLLARLEQENNALATNPKSGIATPPGTTKHQRQSRSQSLIQIKRLINDPARSELRYSQLPPPPMTELEFWAALVADYPQTAQRLPTLTSNKIQSGVVWPSLAGARDPTLLEEFQRLSGESSPYDGLIGKDIGRSFPNVEMFRDPNGEGQQMLARVLRCFSLYDAKIGYCQGLGFVVGPLLMHMSDAEAFCVLVRLMEHYNLRTCYLPDLSGLHLHVYQFQNLLARLRPTLFAHLEALGVEPVYVSQWFLSFFAVACPLPMLLRIYDVIFLEGACETLMRVALSLMQRNEQRLMACTEFEDVMQLLLSRSIWDTYAFNADDLVNDFVSLTSLVTNESLQALEASYNQSQGVPTGVSLPSMQAAASRFLGRLWAGSGSHNSVRSLNPNTSPSRPVSTIRRSTSKQSMTSTLNSIETVSDASTAPTELSTATISVDGHKSRVKSNMSAHKDRDLHTQIEDLLMALSDLQRQQADLSRELQQEREDREEDNTLAKEMLKHLQEQTPDERVSDLISQAQARFSSEESKHASIPQTKQQLHDDMTRWKQMHEVEASRCLDLTRRMDDYEKENSSLKDQLREARSRIQDGYHDRQRLERRNQELRAKTPTSEFSPAEASVSPSSSNEASSPTSTGLREFKLSRTNSQKTTPSFSKRSSSLGLQTVLSTENNKPAAEETLLLELVNAKTAEAVAKQELEEVKCKMESLRKMISAPHARPENRHSYIGHSSSRGSISKVSTESAKSTGSSHTGGNGGFFSGWGRRAAPSNEAPS
ncbi:uncharacterized protein N7477_010202 [Penicillium maclennaniae]|uniref:uncharacterized protein n=1 Tax=Penicillium maclennaniae TaxID=1343394 RepID=UPI0025412D7B|nr:uncharacterized protein N7477_010202 [Penicillium maclennaniae]KAJ5662586.1 hypothetical protein N7477_010202 [Penicillium maclennaniae]